MTGSHLDTQPTGGKFDGAYGVMAGLEVLRTLNDPRLRHRGADRGRGMDQRGGLPLRAGHGGARACSAAPSRSTMRSRIKDRDGVSFGEALKKIGYDGKEPVGGRPVGAFFEAHIEQGPILERENKTIGVVTGAQGQRWYEISWTGMESHAGTTPMEGRARCAGRRRRADRRGAQDRQPAERALDRGRDRKPAAVAQHHPRPRVHDGRLPPSRR